MRQKRSVRRMSKENVNRKRLRAARSPFFTPLIKCCTCKQKQWRNVLKEVNTVFAQLSKNIFLYASQSKMLNQAARK